jgi:hypothetical protein
MDVPAMFHNPNYEKAILLFSAFFVRVQDTSVFWRKKKTNRNIKILSPSNDRPVRYPGVINIPDMKKILSLYNESTL